MKQPPRNEQQLERFIGSVLRSQPLRRAPPTLEARVLRVLAAEAARPWWLQGFTRWPWMARLVFVPLGLGCVQLSLLATARLASLWQALQHTAPASSAWSGLQRLGDLAQAVQTLGGLLTRGIPAAWIYGGAGLTLLLYAALFGLGAVAFRTLIATPDHLRY
jgi:hypothetical protein